MSLIVVLALFPLECYRTSLEGISAYMHRRDELSHTF